MNESKSDLTDRLRREGRWAEASLRKDAIKNELRATGMPRREAGEEAWKRIAEEFPPLPEPDATGEPNTADGDPADAKKKYDAQLDRYYDILTKNVRKVIASFVSSFEVELTDDARRSLESDFVWLVDDYVRGISGRDWEAESESLAPDECVLAGTTADGSQQTESPFGSVDQ